MSKWPNLTLSEAGVRLIDCVHKTPAAVMEGLPYIGIPQMNNGELDFAGVRLISEADFAEWTRKASPEAFDVVLSRRCNPGETAYVRPGMTFALGQNLVLLRADGKEVRPSFLRWLVRTDYWWREVEKYRNVGAVFDSLRCADVPKFQLPVPPLVEQDAISEILAALDDKIDLNRRMNETLEQTARAIFKDWFVDFGPTRAKMAGQEAYLSEDLWALFPERLDEAGVPEGWSWHDVKSLCSVVTNGGTPKRATDEYWRDGTIPWYKTGELTDGFLLSPSEHITQEGLMGSSVKLLPPGAVIMAIYAAPTVGRLGILTTPATFNQACTGMVPKDKVGTWFLYLCLYFGRYWFNNRANGAAQQNISKAIVESYQTITPNMPVLIAFNENVEPIFEKMRINAEESRTLAQTRDLLLPKLMSGELRVQDAEAQVAEVV